MFITNQKQILCFSFHFNASSKCIYIFSEQIRTYTNTQVLCVLTLIRFIRSSHSHNNNQLGFLAHFKFADELVCVTVKIRASAMMNIHQYAASYVTRTWSCTHTRTHTRIRNIHVC